MGDETGQMADPEAVTAKLKEVFESASPGMLYVPTLSSDQPSSVESHRIALAVSEGIPNVLAYQDPSANVDFRPRFFVDLALHMKRKLELVAIYDGSGLENVSTDLAHATALFWGRFAQHHLAEPLEVVRSGSG